MLGTSISPDTAWVTPLSPTIKGTATLDYLTQFSCKLTSSDTTNLKIAGFTPARKISIPFHYISSTFHKQEFSFVSIISKNLLNQGGVVAINLYSSKFDLISLTATKLGDS